MPDIEIITFYTIIISIIALCNFPFIIMKRKNFLKFMPGLTLLVMSFIIGALDDIFILFYLDFIEILCLFNGASLIFIAILLEISDLKNEM